MLDSLHDRITRNLDRVIISRPGVESRCVLISQAELDALERALEILSCTPEASAMRAEVLRIAASAASQGSISASSLS